MQQFTVPQFIDVEDKIIGPITTRQFVILLASFLFLAAMYKLLDFGLFVVVAIIVCVAAGAFSFLKINGRPFHFFVENVVRTSRRAHLRVWNKEDVFIPEVQAEKDDKAIEKLAPVAKKPYKKSHLNALALMVDTEGVYKGEEINSETKIEKI